MVHRCHGRQADQSPNGVMHSGHRRGPQEPDRGPGGVDAQGQAKLRPHGKRHRAIPEGVETRLRTRTRRGPLTGAPPGPAARARDSTQRQAPQRLFDSAGAWQPPGNPEARTETRKDGAHVRPMVQAGCLTAEVGMQQHAAGCGTRHEDAREGAHRGRGRHDRQKPRGGPRGSAERPRHGPRPSQAGQRRKLASTRGRRDEAEGGGRRWPIVRLRAQHRSAQGLQSHSHACEGPRREGHLLVHAWQPQHPAGDVTRRSEGGREESLGRVEARAGAAQQEPSKMHPRRDVAGWQGGAGRQWAPGRKVLSWVAHEGSREAQAHGCVAGSGVLHNGQEAKAPRRRAASEERDGNARADSACRRRRKMRGRWRQASKLSTVSCALQRRLGGVWMEMS